jgi:hypothetical protein
MIRSPFLLDLGEHFHLIQLSSFAGAAQYNIEHVFLGEHLSKLDRNMAPINANKSPGKYLKDNQRPRYHFLDFPSDVPIVPAVVFKHYFSVNVSYLKRLKRGHFICRLSELFREDLSARFSAYLARIALPD